MVSEGEQLDGRFEVNRILGHGSFGVVYAGRDLKTGQDVALKLLHSHFLQQTEIMARFWNEAEALRRLRHPNVVTFIFAGATPAGVPYLVTELLAGETFRELFNREGALPPLRALQLLGPAAHALYYAHQAGILHRDLKPENIFRSRKDGTGTTKILDFGVAKLLDTPAGQKLSHTGVLIGTLAYSPPEQIAGIIDIDHRSDQFGFATLMYEALTSRHPFPQTNPIELFQAITLGRVEPISSLNPSLPSRVDAVFARAMSPNRNNRFDSIGDFFTALCDALQLHPASYVPTQQEMTRELPAVDGPKFMRVPDRVDAPALDSTVRADSLDALLQSAPRAMPPGGAPTMVSGNASPPAAPSRAFSQTVQSGVVPPMSAPANAPESDESLIARSASATARMTIIVVILVLIAVAATLVWAFFLRKGGG